MLGALTGQVKGRSIAILSWRNGTDTVVEWYKPRRLSICFQHSQFETRITLHVGEIEKKWRSTERID
jgi:hypothetical protein